MALERYQCELMGVSGSHDLPVKRDREGREGDEVVLSAHVGFEKLKSDRWDGGSPNKQLMFNLPLSHEDGVSCVTHA